MNKEKEFNDMTACLMKDPNTIKQELSSVDCALIHSVMGVCGEAGELLDAVKKHVIYRKPLDLDNVIEELGDLEFYMQTIRQELGICREETLIFNMNKLAERYKKYQYSDKAAVERADKADG